MKKRSGSPGMNGQAGMTIIELAVSVAVLLVMTLAMYPLFEAARVSYASNSATFTVLKEARKGLAQMKEDIPQTRAGFIAIDPDIGADQGHTIAFPVSVARAGAGTDVDSDGSTGETGKSPEAGHEMVFMVGADVIGFNTKWKGICVYCPTPVRDGAGNPMFWQLSRFVVTAGECGLGTVDDGLNEELPLASVTYTEGNPATVDIVGRENLNLTINVETNQLVGGGNLAVRDEVLANYLATTSDQLSGMEYSFTLNGDLLELMLPIQRAPQSRPNDPIRTVLRASLMPRVYSI